MAMAWPKNWQRPDGSDQSGKTAAKLGFWIRIGPQYAQARCYPKKRWIGFDFKFKKFSIKQAFFINDIFSSRVKARFIYMKSGLKVKRRLKKTVKSREKKLQIFFCLRAFTCRDEMPLIKVAHLMLNFLNLKSKPIHLFFG